MAAPENMDDLPAKQAGSAAEPEMVAATEHAFPIGSREARIVLKIHAATGPARHRQVGTEAIFLRIENVTCDTVAPNFSAYLNVPAGAVPEDHPELFAGALGMFGLAEASAIKGEHGGSGKGFTLDISRLFHSLEGRREWNPHELSVSFVPQYWDSPVPRVQVGRVSLYLQ